jgi:RepB DNA-primase from phage plasmid
MITGATDSREGKALAMLTAFFSVGVRSFDVTFTDIEGEKTGFQINRPIEILRRSIGKAIGAAIDLRQNYIIRPRSNSVTLIQLDDLDSAKAERVAAHAFMVLQTSPGNFQAWVAVKDAPEDLARRLRKGAGADPTASGATRISGSVNFKTKYAPEFPFVELSQVNAGRVTTPAALEHAGIVAAQEEPRPPRQVINRISPSGRASRKKWPSYKFCVDHAPMTHGEDRPDISRADFTWCRTAIEWGWSREETAGRLMELSSKAKEMGERYAILTATRAGESVERQPHRLKAAPNPR